jgi:hypothetical protein
MNLERQDLMGIFDKASNAGRRVKKAPKVCERPAVFSNILIENPWGENVGIATQHNTKEIIIGLRVEDLAPKFKLSINPKGNG